MLFTRLLLCPECGEKQTWIQGINESGSLVLLNNKLSFIISWFKAVLRIRIRIRSDPGFLGHPDPDPGKKFTDPDPDPDPDPSSTIIFKSQNNGI